MVCDSCEKKGKLTVLANPDKWKDGSKNNITSSTSTTSSNSTTTTGNGGPIKVGKSNKLLQKSNEQWISKSLHCRICKTKTLLNYNYCNNCAHIKGICTICGKKIIDSNILKSLKMSLT